MSEVPSRRIRLVVENGLSGASAFRLLDVVASLPTSEFDTLFLSLKAPTIIDVSAVAALVRLYSHLRRLRKSLVITDVDEQVALRLADLGLAAVIPVRRLHSARGEAEIRAVKVT